MKKKLSILLVITMVILTIVGCGGGASTDTTSTTSANADAKAESNGTATETATEKVEEKVEPLDLTGLWIQNNGKESYMTGIIKEDGSMGLFFILEGDDTPWTYWIGTYDAPTDDKDEYSWTSTNTYGGNGLLASSADTKDFKYKDGKITYEVSMQGETMDVELIRGEWDTSNIPSSAFTSVKVDTADVKPLELKDSGWFVKSGEWLYYYVDIYNPNEDIAVEYPSFRITARDSSNVLLGTEDQTLSIIYPGHHFIYGSQAFSVDEIPDKVEFEMLDPEDYNLKSASGLGEYKNLEVVNTGLRSEKFVGEINNPNDQDYDTVAVVVICKDASGNVVNIENTFVDDVKGGTTTPFDISTYSKDEFDTMEFYANQW